MFNKKTILITGGTGSFGKKFTNSIHIDFGQGIMHLIDENMQNE